MHIPKFSILLTAAFAAANPLAASAQTASGAGDADASVVLDTIVVTPLRRATSLQRSTSSVTVIDTADIERSAAPDLPSLLKSYSGVSI